MFSITMDVQLCCTEPLRQQTRQQRKLQLALPHLLHYQHLQPDSLIISLHSRYKYFMSSDSSHR